MINSLTSPEEILEIDQIQRVFTHRPQLDPMKDLITSKINPVLFTPIPGKTTAHHSVCRSLLSHMGLEPMTQAS